MEGNVEGATSIWHHQMMQIVQASPATRVDSPPELPPLPEFSDLVYEMDVNTTTYSERWEMVQELTIEAYARIGIDVRNMPMRRDLVRVIRVERPSRPTSGSPHSTSEPS